MLSDYHSLHELSIIQHVYFRDNHRRSFTFQQLSRNKPRNRRQTHRNPFFNLDRIFPSNRYVHRLLRSKTKHSTRLHIPNVRWLHLTSLHVPVFPNGFNRNFADYFQYCCVGQQLFFGFAE